MKQMLFLLVFVFSFPFLKAQNSNESIDFEQKEKTFDDRKAVIRINADELPEGVQRVVSNGEFRKWEIEEVYRVNCEVGDKGDSAYILVVKRRLDRFALYYDSSGKLIRQERMEEIRRS
ncbi:MAG: hypothetical protein H0V01_02005 [Bacteroidetes bacterium]|nr:hypothetical protein [Bacteroidota bacterium]HET6243317.1 hypothetical protein [Bacteroidia bacterium]